MLQESPGREGGMCHLWSPASVPVRAVQDSCWHKHLLALQEIPEQIHQDSIHLRVINNRYSPVLNFDQQWVTWWGRGSFCSGNYRAFLKMAPWLWTLNVALVHFMRECKQNCWVCSCATHWVIIINVINSQTEGKVNCVFLMSNVVVQVWFVKYKDKFLPWRKLLLIFTASTEDICH